MLKFPLFISQVIPGKQVGIIDQETTFTNLSFTQNTESLIRQVSTTAMPLILK